MSVPSILTNALGGVANAANDSVQTEAEDTTGIKTLPSQSGAAGTQTVNALTGTAPTQNLQQPGQAAPVSPGQQGGTLGAAQQAAAQAGGIEKAIASPQAQTVVNKADQQALYGNQEFQQAVNQYQQDVHTVNQKQIDAEDAIKQANSVADIDPQRYVSNMGIGQSTLTALVMALSGIGSGLTGQPNLAMQAFQSNIDRDIAAQKQVFLNKAAVASQSQGLLQTAQDRAHLDLAAQQAATFVVNSGLSNVMNGTQMLVKAQTSPQMAAIVSNKLQTDALGAITGYNALYTGTAQSGDRKKLNGMGNVADAVKEQVTGKGIGPIAPGGAAQRVQPQSANPAMGTSKNAAIPGAPAQPMQAPASEDFFSKLIKKFSGS